MPFTAKYSDDQREAVAHAYLDKRIRPARRVTALAAAGELEIDGRTVAAFDIAPQSVRQMSSTVRRRRAGTLRSGLTDVEPADAMESLRRRLIAAADHELRLVERRQRRKEPVNPEHLRQIARAAKEAATIPTRDAPAPKHHGQRSNGEQPPQGIAGSILQAHRRVDGAPATEGVYTGETTAENVAAADRSDADAATDADHGTDRAGSWVRAEVGRMRSGEGAAMRDPTDTRTPQP